MVNADKIELLIRKGRTFCTKNDYPGAYSCFKRAAELLSDSTNKDKKAWVLAAAAYMAMLDKQIPGGLKLLASAIASGYADLEKMNSLAQIVYKGKRLGDTRSFKILYSAVRRNAEPIRVSRYNNQQLDAWQWMHFSQASDLKDLRKQLPQFSNKTEWGLFIECMDWAHRCFTHDAVKHAGFFHPAVIIREAKTKKCFTCQEYAVILAACLQAQGYPARVIVLLKEGYHYGSGKGHWVTEVWSNHFDKWIMLDPQNNCYWKNGTLLLNAAEIRDLILDKKVKHIKAFTKRKESRAMMEWLDHFHAIWYYRNQDYFKHWRADGEVEELGFLPALLFQGKARQGFNYRSAPDCLYPKMNKINFKCMPARNSIDFRLHNSFAYFSRYECAVNGTSWKRISNKPRIKLSPGSNEILFRVRDLFDRISKPVGIKLEINSVLSVCQRNKQ